ncbi:MAG: cadherin-like domain-containing protein [Crocosphaera sp.]
MIQTVLNFDPLMLESYGGSNQDISLQTTVADNGNTLKLVGNGWKKVDLSYTITADTILEFDFKSSYEGEIHGIGFDIDDHLDPNSLFKLHGTQNWGIRNFDNYQISTGDTWTHYRIRVGDFFTGDVSYLTFANDHDVPNTDVESIFSNIRIYENQAPVASNNNLTTTENTPITIVAAELLSNDSDPDGNTLKVTKTNNAINGTFSFDSNENLVFIPDANFTGVASFDYTISDGNGKTDTATVTIEVKAPIVNIVKNGTFTTINGESPINFDWRPVDSTDAGKGWIAANEHQWNFDGTNQWADTDNTGAWGLTQVINNNKLTKGLQGISFDAKSLGSNNQLRLRVYGVDGEFTTNNWNALPPESLDDSPINVVTLLDTNNIATEEFDWRTFIWDSVDFGNGYEYIVLKFLTEGIDETEFQAIDNVTVGSLPENPRTPPQASDDHFVTQKNNSLTILESDLLANDVDPNGQVLKITEVNNARDGNVSLDSQGNIFFTPHVDFAGVTSFDYTIRNDQGLWDKATVTINVPSSVALGTNLLYISDWSTQVPFVDRFKSSRRWITQMDWKPEGWIPDTQEYDLLDLDENGWVKSLPAPEEAPQYTKVSTIFTHLDQGRYIVLYEGEGEIEYKNGGTIAQSASVEGRDVIDVGSSESLLMTITKTDPNGTGDYIRNIRLIPEAHESTYQTETFNPTFLEKTQPFHALRFMDWMRTNHSTQGEWSERPTLDDYTWSELGPPVEVMVELANTLDRDAWFNMPHLATDEYVTNFATYVRDHLEPELKVYVEYSNEVWNWHFEQAHWVSQQPENDPNFNGNSMNWFGKRTTEITQIWDQVFEETGQKEQVIGVMAAQAFNTWTAEQALNYDSWSTENKTHADYGIDAIAIAPYFGGYLGTPEHQAEVETWTVDQVFDELTQGGVLTNGPAGGALQNAYDHIANYADLAKQEGLQLIAYEGGQHLVGHGGVENNQGISDLFIAANRDPRMGELYKEYFANWYQQGGGLFMNWVDVDTPSKWGSWGALESIAQDGSPKYDALMDLIENGIPTAQ